MTTMRLDFVSQDHEVFGGEVSAVIAPGVEGQLTILPKHAPLITLLSPGEVTVRREGHSDAFFAVSGGWMEVQPTHVNILARTAEHAEDINLSRAEAARARAEEMLAQAVSREDRTTLELALRRSQIRLRVATHKRGRRPSGTGEGAGVDAE